MAEKRYPFKFLDAYAREDSDIFFGRNDEIETLYEMVFQSDLLLVYGASGTGKTSLIQCGLANKFQTHDWLPLFIRRGSNLNEAFADALENAGGTLAETDNSSLDWLDEDLSSEKNALAATNVLSPLARRLRAIYLRHFKPVYLIFDQFEELYVLGDKKEQNKFIESVQEILRVEQPVKIIISIREEYLGYLYAFERAVPELLRKKLRVEAMNLDKVQTVITSVGQLPNSNVRLQTGQEAEIANQIFEKIRGGATSLTIELPYLQVFLDKLYLRATGDEHRKADALLSLDTLKKIGNIGDVLRDFLDEQVLLIARTLDQKPDAIWQILSPLVTLDGTKEPLSGPDLCNRRPEMAATLIDSTLQALVKGRILRFSEHNQRYEIAHDSLAKQIAAKRSDEEIALLEVQRMVKSQVAMKAEAREFFSEKQLAFMEPYLKKLTLGAEENTHLENSRKFLRQKKKKQQRRKKVTYASIAAAFVLLAALALWALGQKKTAEESLEKVERTEIVKKAEELKTYGDSYRDLQKDSTALDTYRQAWDTLDFYGNKHPELRDEEVYQALKKILNK
ncbi:MAG: ATP-binding protein [Saprospiraceae bacterium]